MSIAGLLAVPLCFLCLSTVIIPVTVDLQMILYHLIQSVRSIIVHFLLALYNILN